MEPYEDFTKGEEVSLIKNYLKNLNTLTILGVILGYLIMLDLLPKFTLAITVFGLISLVATHFLKKWAKK